MPNNTTNDIIQQNVINNSFKFEDNNLQINDSNNYIQTFPTIPQNNFNINNNVNSVNNLNMNLVNNNTNNFIDNAFQTDNQQA